MEIGIIEEMRSNYGKLNEGGRRSEVMSRLTMALSTDVVHILRQVQ